MERKTGHDWFYINSLDRVSSTTTNIDTDNSCSSRKSYNPSSVVSKFVISGFRVRFEKLQYVQKGIREKTTFFAFCNTVSVIIVFSNRSVAATCEALYSIIILRNRNAPGLLVGCRPRLYVRGTTKG